MKSVIAILTYNRRPALEACLASLAQHTKCPIAIFEDCGTIDDTEAYLRLGRASQGFDTELASEKLVGPDGLEVFMGKRNVGVAAQSNKAICWFQRSDANHLLLLNDDVVATGDFVTNYATAHTLLDVGLLCFCGFNSPEYKCLFQRVNGRVVKVLSRLTGSMLSFTRSCLHDIGYFDTSFKQFGEEHVDMTHRARLAGYIQLKGEHKLGLDIEPSGLKQQDVETSLQGAERDTADTMATRHMAVKSRLYPYTQPYLGYSLKSVDLVGARDGTGIERRLIPRYQLVPAL